MGILHSIPIFYIIYKKRFLFNSLGYILWSACLVAVVG